MKLPIPLGDFRAYLFDCDGTIADSMPLHYIAWKKSLAEWNCDLSEDLFYAWGGRPPVEIVVDSTASAASKCPSRPSSNARRISTMNFFRNSSP